MIIIEHAADCGPGAFTRWLEAHGAGPLHVVRPYTGDPVPDTAPEGLLVLGGEMHAREDDRAPWLPEVRALLRDSVANRTPALGICLGAQLLAEACGGSVSVSAPAGPERGVIEIRTLPGAAADPVLGVLPTRCTVIAAHRDGIRTLPTDAELLAESDRYPQAFRVGPAAWGVQFHPEATPEIVTDWGRSTQGEERTALHAAAAEVASAWPEVSLTGEALARARPPRPKDLVLGHARGTRACGTAVDAASHR